jgi:uncharacterized protein HemX
MQADDDVQVQEEFTEKNLILMEIQKSMNLIEHNRKQIEDNVRVITIHQKELDILFRKIDKQQKRLTLLLKE